MEMIHYYLPACFLFAFLDVYNQAGINILNVEAHRSANIVLILVLLFECETSFKYLIDTITGYREISVLKD